MKLTKAERVLRNAQKQAPQPKVQKPTPSSVSETRPALSPVPILEWQGMYDDSWKGALVDDAFAHPAKAARALLNRIFDHLFEIGALKKGGTVVDPFAGIFTTGIIGAWRGLHVIGCELEPKFVELAQANIELHRANLLEMQLTLPIIVQGDSRQLRTHLQPVIDAVVSSPPRVDAVMASPPYIQGGHHATAWNLDETTNDPEIRRQRVAKATGEDPSDVGTFGSYQYGEAEGQLGAMPKGDFDAIVSSPPYVSGGHHPDQTGAWNTNQRGQRGTKELAGYGQTNGQLGQMQDGDVDAIVSSPPYAKDALGTSPSQSEGPSGRPNQTRGASQPFDKYGETPGQLGRMDDKREGVDAVIASPPYAEIATGAGGLNTKPAQHEGQQAGRSPQAPSQDTDQRYGETEGQLAQLAKGDVDVIISSPPYADQSLQPGESSRPEVKIARLQAEGKFDDAEAVRRNNSGGANNLRQQDYGSTEGQLAQMVKGEVDTIISSPPYAETLLNDDQRQAGKGEKLRWGTHEEYGTSPGQLGVLKEEQGIDALISSPPFGTGDSASAQSMMARTDKSAQWVKANCGSAATEGYGDMPGQMAEMTMPPNGVDAVITSPPYEGSKPDYFTQDDRAKVDQLIQAGKMSGNPSGHANAVRVDPYYGQTQGQLGGEIGDTFWSAALQIVRESYAILKPGGHAVWIVKSFVRDKQIVDFPADWRKLCEFVGFETLTEVHAMLVKQRAYTDLFGEEAIEKRERKSFFRRLAERHGSPAIDYEVVYVMVKRG